MEQTNQTFLTEDRIGRLMRRYALPCILSLVVAALYNIVDQIFISNAPDLGSFGNAANTAVFPLTVVALAVAVMIGDGACTSVSISMGEGDAESVHRTVGNAVCLSVASGVILGAVFLLFPTPLLIAFGADINGQTMELAREYLFWIAWGIPFYVFGQTMNPIIRSDGSPRFAMFATLAGAVCNLILDPVFLFVFHWGMAGAAVATVLGQVLTAVLSVVYLLRSRSFRLRGDSYRLRWGLIRRFLSLGICSFLAQISLVAAMAATNRMIAASGAADPIFGQEVYRQIPMAVFGIVMKVFQIVIAVSIGMAAGCIPIVGYNVGAGRTDRARGLFTRLLIGEAAVGLIALLIVEIWPVPLIRLFGAAQESVYYTEFAVRVFRIYLCCLPLATVNKASFIFLQSLGRAWVSTMLSMLREIVLGVGFVLLLPTRFGLNGVLFSMPAADVCTFLVSFVVIVLTYRRLRRAA